MTRELITRASYLNTNFNQVIYFYKFLRSTGMLFYVSLHSHLGSIRGRCQPF